MSGKSTRRPLVAGNWKLHKNVAESVALARDLKNRLAGTRECEVAVAPVFTALAAVGQVLEGSGIRLAGQDVYWEEQGAYTGEVSPPLLGDVGCTMCVVGHSERRQHFGETDESVRRKAKALLAHGMTPILCIGETLEQREAGATLSVVVGQLEAALEGLFADEVGRVVVAYEPIWAIGTGRTASPADAQEVHEAIRGNLRQRHSEAVADGTRVLYGGSVKPDNAADLMAQPDVDGALVGGASLKAETFEAIVKAAG